MEPQESFWAGWRPRRRTELALAVLILVIAALFRLWRLDSVPPGLTHDEANNVHDSGAILDGVRPLYFPVAQGKEPLYPYSVATVMALLGRGPWVMRLCSAIWSLLLIGLAYFWVRRAFHPMVGLYTAAGLAVGFWPVSTGRLGLRAITLPVMVTAFSYLLWRAMDRAAARDGDPPADRRTWLAYALTGVALGACFYTYLASRVMPAVVVLFGAYLLFSHRSQWRRVWRGFALVLLVAAVVAAPLFFYLNAHPSAEIRLGQLDRPLRELLAGKPGLLLGRAAETAAMFSFRGDTFIPYNLPGKPIFDPVMSALFYLGLACALWRWRRPANFFALLWLLVGMFPALATGVEAASLRGIAALPAVYLFPALGASAAGEALGRLRVPEQLARQACVGGMVLAVIVAGVGSWQDYHVRWAEDRDVRVHYHVDLLAASDVVRSSASDAVAVAALYPGQYHDPRVVEAELGGADPRVRWFDPRGGLALPDAGTVTLVVPEGLTIPPELWSFVESDLDRSERVDLGPDELVSYLEIYHLSQPGANPGWADLARFGDQLALQGYQLYPHRPAPGQTTLLMTTWQVNGLLPADLDAVMFAQLLGPDGGVVAQDDRLDVPSWGWQVSDRLIQLFRLAIPADLAPGEHRLIVGVYTAPDRVDAVLAGREPDSGTPRLPVSVEGQAVGDSFEIAFTVRSGRE